MSNKSNDDNENRNISRRNFVKFGGAAIAGSTLKLSPVGKLIPGQDEAKGATIKKYKILGRTGFKVSDIGMGTTRLKDSNVVRYAYDKGVNYFDTAEGYSNGRAEKWIGEALQQMDRKKIFITSKINIKKDESTENILKRFHKCQERLQTDYIDAFCMHNVTDVTMLNHSGFHAAIKQLKAEGKVRFTGLSCHGSRRQEGDSMEKVLCAAAEDGRFDLMLFVYNFMNKEVGTKVLAACKKNNVGTTAMKTAPGVLKVDPVDPENLTNEQQEYVNRMMQRGRSKEQAIERLQQRIASQQETQEKSQPFVDKYGIKTTDQLRLTSINWVSQNPDMHTTCVSFADFDLVDKVIPLSGAKLSQAEMQFLEDYKLVFDNQYCRHGCNECVVECIYRLPVSTIMRYAYYYECQGREKDSMQKYAALKNWNASNCIGCDAPCVAACPYGVDIQANLMQAHSLLTLV